MTTDHITRVNYIADAAHNQIRATIDAIDICNFQLAIKEYPKKATGIRTSYGDTDSLMVRFNDPLVDANNLATLFHQLHLLELGELCRLCDINGASDINQTRDLLKEIIIISDNHAAIARKYLKSIAHTRRTIFQNNPAKQTI